MSDKEEIKEEIKTLNYVLSNLNSWKQEKDKSNSAKQILGLMKNEFLSSFDTNYKFAKPYFQKDDPNETFITDGIEALEIYPNNKQGQNADNYFLNAVEDIESGIQGIILNLEENLPR